MILAALASIGLGLVIGPEAPLIAIGAGIGIFAARQLRKDAPAEVGTLLGSAAAFAALAFLIGSPVIAAVILIEATGLGGPRLPVVLVPGLLASGIGSLVWLGVGSLTGLSTSNIALTALELPDYARPDVVDFGWTILLAAGIAVVTFVIFRLAKQTQGLAARRPFLLLPAIGLVVAGLAIAFSEATDKSVSNVLFSGQDAIGELVADSGSWSLSALALLIAFKGLAYGLSLGSPTFPALFLGAAAGLMAAQLPGFSATPAVSVAIGAAVVAVLQLPLSAAVLAVVLTAGSGPGAGPLIIVGVVVAYLITLALTARQAPEGESEIPAATAEGDAAATRV
ncbi:MAG TPA: chloride channel protein [Thermoleophilaceae bacterium]|nr:chloride channel protein [Thermoleophilaceae bacterium]